MIEVKITAAEDLQVTVAPTDAGGNPAPIEPGSLQITTDNAAVIAGAAGDGPLRCVTVAPGVALLTIEGDADLGSGVETISEQISVTVDHIHATNLGVTVQGVPK